MTYQVEQPCICRAWRRGAHWAPHPALIFPAVPRPAPCPQAISEKRRWELVVFDPPKLAPNRKALDKATRKYRKLNLNNEVRRHASVYLSIMCQSICPSVRLSVCLSD